MVYLRSFFLPEDCTEDAEMQEKRGELINYLMQFTDKDSLYPWNFFKNRKPKDCEFEFSDITILYGGNGSGKTTLLNLIGEKLKLPRINMFNHSPTFDYYVSFCEAVCEGGDHAANSLLPIRTGKIITSDDIFSEIIMQREKELNYESERQTLRNELARIKRSKVRARMNFETGEGVSEFLEAQEVKRNSFRKLIRSRMTEVLTRSNGENAFDYFVNSIPPKTLVLLDEPENSLSARWQKELASFIYNCAVGDRCQFVISTHSPFLLAIPGAKIYNLDSPQIAKSNWTDLENVRIMYELFKENEDLFSE